MVFGDKSYSMELAIFLNSENEGFLGEILGEFLRENIWRKKKQKQKKLNEGIFCKLG
jgi:hypothetical protein